MIEDESERGTGRTTRQILNAPRHTIYVWYDNNLDYVKRLVRHLGREDLTVISKHDIHRARVPDDLIVYDHYTLQTLLL